MSLSSKLLTVLFFSKVFTCIGSEQKEGETLCLAENGHPCSVIVTGKNPGRIVRFAADELKHYLDKITGADFLISETWGQSPRIFLGDSHEAREAGFDLSSLRRDGFFRAVSGNDIFILGNDDKEKGCLDKMPPVASWTAERGTLYGVYDFLEDECGVRWFMPGEKGELAPANKSLRITRKSLREEPRFLARSIVYFDMFYYCDNPGGRFNNSKFIPFLDVKECGFNERELNLWGLRMRYQTTDITPGAHSESFLKFDKRFAAKHPEYFAVLEDNQRAINTIRGSFLCYSSGVFDEFEKDMTAYFSGQTPSSRKLESWSNIGFGDFFCVDPADSYPGCYCEACQRIIKKHPETKFSEIIYPFIVKMANSAKRFSGKLISTLAYPPKLLPPETVELPETVSVRLCVSGPSYSILPEAGGAQDKLLGEWSKKSKGPIALWNYACEAYFWEWLHGVVQTQPHAISDYYKKNADKIKGAFYENESIFYMYRMLDSYVALKVLWDPALDIDALLRDFYDGFFGPAAGPMGKFYSRLEENWTKILTAKPEEKGYLKNVWLEKPFTTPDKTVIWEKIFSDSEMRKLDGFIAEAEKLSAGSELYKWRVGIVKKHVMGNIRKYREAFLATMSLAGKNTVACPYVSETPVLDGKLDDNAWTRASEISMISQAKNQPLSAAASVRLLKDQKYLHIGVKCGEPLMDKIKALENRKKDDPLLWEDNEIEVAFTPTLGADNLKKIMINSNGVCTDLAISDRKNDFSWNFESDIAVFKAKDFWSAEIRIPLRNLPLNQETGKLYFNAMRYRVIKDTKPELYTTSATRAWQETDGFSEILFTAGDKNLLKNGSFESVYNRGADGKDYPANWSPFPGYEYMKADKEIKKSGEFSVMLTGCITKRVYIEQAVTGLKPGKKYKLSFRISTKGVDADRTDIYNGAYAQVSATGLNLYVPAPAFTGDTDWRDVTSIITIPEKSDGTLVIRPHMMKCNGKAWFDDIELSEIEETN